MELDRTWFELVELFALPFPAPAAPDALAADDASAEVTEDSPCCDVPAISDVTNVNSTLTGALMVQYYGTKSTEYRHSAHSYHGMSKNFHLTLTSSLRQRQLQYQWHEEEREWS